jgi:hypothetical protein
MNPHLDAVPLAHAGRTAMIRFSWRALQVLQRDWGEGWSQRFVDALTGEKVEDMAALISITSGMSVDEVMDWSPPTSIASAALWDAYSLTKLGQKPAEEGAAQNPLKALSRLSKVFAGLRFGPGSAGPNSGNRPPTQPAST